MMSARFWIEPFFTNNNVVDVAKITCRGNIFVHFLSTKKMGSHPKSAYEIVRNTINLYNSKANVSPGLLRS